jgi:hypothetical protein
MRKPRLLRELLQTVVDHRNVSTLYGIESVTLKPGWKYIGRHTTTTDHWREMMRVERKLLKLIYDCLEEA